MTTSKARKKALERKHPWEGHVCGECENAHDWHNKAVDGHYTLARCPYEEWCVIYGQRACEHFKGAAKVL